jgi:hypothetical protein
MDLDSWRWMHERYTQIATESRSKAEPQTLADLLNKAYYATSAPNRVLPHACVSNGRVSFKLEVGSLFMSFVLMLLLDLSKDGVVRRCADPNCNRLFTAARPNRKYCQIECAQKFARRRWWNKTGSQARETRKKADKKEHE